VGCDGSPLRSLADATLRQQNSELLVCAKERRGLSVPSKRSNTAFTPVEPAKRIEAVDIVRGFALFGVLLVNMYNFGASWPIWTSQPDRIASAAMRFLFETKSWRLFSFLFGLGFSLQLLSARRRGQPFLARHLRRLAALFVIGAGHALFYDGDILMLYAELGLLLTLFIRVPPRVLLALAVGLLAMFPLGGLVRSLDESSDMAVEVDPPETGAEWYERRRPELEAHPYAVGSIAEVFRFNSAAIPPQPFDDPVSPESNAAFFAMFLLGLYVGMRGIVQDLDGHRSLIRSVSAWGLGAGMSGMAIERILASTRGYELFGPHGVDPLTEFVGDVAFTFGSTALSLGYAATIVLLARSSRGRAWVRPLAPVGRLALTVYLTQSLIFTTLFYGYGFGLAGAETGPVGVTGMAIVIFAIQMCLAGWWVRYFRFGPAEWAWRAVTYLRLAPLRVQSQ
jgi:uncharacterized protein